VTEPHLPLAVEPRDPSDAGNSASAAGSSDALAALEAALEASPTGFCILAAPQDGDDPECLVVALANMAAREVLPELRHGARLTDSASDGGALHRLALMARQTRERESAIHTHESSAGTRTVSYSVAALPDGRVVGTFRDISDRVALESAADAAAAELERKRRLMNRSLDSMPLPVNLFDVVRGPDGGIVDFVMRFQNAMSRDGMGSRGRDMTGASIHEVLPEDAEIDIVAALREVATTGESMRVPFRADYGPAGVRYFDALAARVDDDVVVTSTIDQTALYSTALQLTRANEAALATAAELQQAHDAALAIAESRSELLTTVAHELRTPLTTVIAAADLLLDTPLDAGQIALVEQQREASRLLLALIGDTLDLGQLDAGQVVLESVCFVLDDVVAQLDLMMRETLHAKGLYLGWQIGAEVPPSLVGDPVRLEQVLLNLLSNAAKFTQEGGIDARVAVEAADDAGFRLRFEVTDSGRGMHPDEVEQIFEPFQQGSASTRRRYGGSGLGLAITQRLVQQMGGRLWVTSERGAGSTFSFTSRFAVPADEAVPGGPAPEPPHARAAAAERVLLAEDNDVNRIFVAAMLSKLHVTVDTVTNGLEAVQAVGAHDYDLVLMDIRMPMLDGVEATRQIRAREATGTHRCRIVALTASPTPDVTRAALDAGMDGVLGKPISQQELADVVAGLESGIR
jgi:signal transduction histidine kinase/ActR/RegA family two-component response regulator